MKRILVFLLFFSVWKLWAQTTDTLPVLMRSAPVKGLLHADKQEKVFDFGSPVPIDSLFQFSLHKLHSDSFQRILPLYLPQSKSINFLLQNVSLPAHVKFVISNEKGIRMGPYNQKDLSKEGHFLSWPLEGEKIFLRFYAAENADISFRIAHLVYGWHNNIDKVFGSSGACNVNVNCPEGQNFQSPKKSVVMLLNSGGFRFCSGTLVNNTAEDSRPYILTAKHCNAGTSSSFMFNYESPDCSNIDGPTIQTVQGAQLRAQWDQSDFALLEMDQPVPASYYSYFAGWNRANIPSDSVVGIHHPKGDIKKISGSLALLSDTCYSCSNPAPDYWWIKTWNFGTTEQGSSGSPLFDKTGKVIGQLRGGSASCVSSMNDFYGKFSRSWEGGGSPETRLRDWLDPMGINPVQLDGRQSGTAQADTSLAISYFEAESSFICADSLTVNVIITNNGHALNQEICIKIPEYNISQCKTGNWYYGDAIPFQLKIKNPDFGEQKISLLADILHQNQIIYSDSQYTYFTKVAGSPIHTQTQFDSYAFETSWHILNQESDTVYSVRGIDHAPGSLFENQLCLDNGCYRLIVEDSGADDICCKYGDGYIKWYNNAGELLWQLPKFEEKYVYDFCFPIVNPDDNQLFAFPNPTSQLLHVAIPQEYLKEDSEIAILDLSGRILVKKAVLLKYLHTFDVSPWPQGVYIVYIRGKKMKAYTRFVKI